MELLLQEEKEIARELIRQEILCKSMVIKLRNHFFCFFAPYLQLAKGILPAGAYKTGQEFGPGPFAIFS